MPGGTLFTYKAINKFLDPRYQHSGMTKSYLITTETQPAFRDRCHHMIEMIFQAGFPIKEFGNDGRGLHSVEL